ncbi:hypothetical protein CVT25_006230 [Psilocybe cyanescens]|uniref:Uncharacterized protein n=1 Tax=Psilocybe cyanescens TaxID=93625 RepID=A0A409XKI9_PSICY|nr:hypothetical protein CVT25_006230 [Psilocybe cyanescens]
MPPAAGDISLSPRAFGDVDGSRNVNFLPYFTVGALAVLIWDILSELRRDSYLLGLYPLRHSIVIPFRLEECAQIRTAQVSLFVIAIATTYLLIFFRVRGAFQNDGYISGLFGSLWALVVVSASTMVYGTSLSLAESSSSTCAVNLSPKIEPYVSAALLGPLLYMCLVYMFISGRLVVGVRMDLSLEHGVKEFVLGEFVPIFGQGLLREGQAFYLIAVMVQLISFIIFLSSGTATQSTRFILLDSSLVITSMMACKVYRGTLYKEIKIKLENNKIHVLVPLPVSESLGTSSCNVAEIRVTKTVEQF